jgi:hypothetical protein
MVADSSCAVANTLRVMLGSDMWCGIHTAVASYRVIMECCASDESGSMVTGHNHYFVDTKNPLLTQEIYGTKDDGSCEIRS